MALREFVTHPLVLRRLEVIGARDITPRMRRVTLGGPEMAAFERDGLALAPFRAPGFDDHVKVIFAEDGEVEKVLPLQLGEGIEWTSAPGRQARDYTPRRVADGELDLDFVLHGEGPAVQWARAAKPGDPLWIVGPKSSIVLPEEMDWVVLVGDETALPAIGRFLDERPTDAAVHAVITIGAASARQGLALREGDTIEWVVASPTDRDALESAVRAAVPAEGDGFVWAGAESRALLPVRRFLSRERGLAKNRMNLTGYWHADQGADAPQYPEVPSPLAWFAVRAALRAGILDDIADHSAASDEEITSRLGLSPRAFDTIAPTLIHHGLIAEQDGRFRLASAGEALLADEHEREEFDGHEADMLLALSELGPALRDGGSPWERAQGATLAADATADAERFEELRHSTEVLRFVGGALIRDSLWADASRVLLTGPGSAEVADLATEAGIAAVFTVTGDAASELANRSEWLREDDGAAADVAIAAFALGHRTDDEALQLLVQLRERTGTLVVIDAARADSLSPTAHEASVLAFAGNGAGLRDEVAADALAGDAGWRRERTVALGWGIEAAVLCRV
ncbi:siderophore-interacting protein [Microbacterium murale]|uniref:NADPH-dependent ferric siderophore reductase n=1 Tax=Microbacterium murale TaxID=1081040 RepID=A0ABU0PB24_9MICO|nr:siderophore-interacting protein [Microbacterium murale]MDQ0643886.1 NADPH-dependent ferric siderophore reductase [Microbacterium murale]